MFKSTMTPFKIINKKFCHTTNYSKYFEYKKLIDKQIETNIEILKKMEEIQTHNYMILKIVKDLSNQR